MSDQTALDVRAARAAGLTELEQIAVAVAALPGLPTPQPGDRYSVHRLTAAWIGNSTSRHTRRAYYGDLAHLLAWCHRQQLDPLTARRADLDEYRATFTAEMADRTVARHLASASSWYDYLLSNDMPGLAGNPVKSVKRPKISDHDSPTAGLAPDEMVAMLHWADAEADVRRRRFQAAPTPVRRQNHLAALRDRALVRLLADLGLRVNEGLQLDVTSLSYQRGHRTIRYLGKGNKRRERALGAHVLEAIDEYLRLRAQFADVRVDELAGPLFATTGRHGGVGRMDEPAVFKLIRRLARAAGLPSADRLSPHSLRHAFATTAREEGVPLEDVQDAMDHADPRTTRRYDRDRHNLDRDPALVVGARYARRLRPEPDEEAALADLDGHV